MLQTWNFSGMSVRVFQSRYTIAIVYRLVISMYRRVIALTPPPPPTRTPWVGVFQDYVRSNAASIAAQATVSFLKGAQTMKCKL